MRYPASHRRLWLAVVVAAALFGACGGSDAADSADELAAADRGFVGEVDGTDAFIAIVAGGGEAVVYVCDGEHDIAEWFSGPIHDGLIELTSAGGASVAAAQGDDGYRGTVTFADGSRHEFDTEPAGPNAGLLRITGDEAEAAGVVGGWVANNDGEIRGSLRLGGLATIAPAPADSVTVNSTRFPVSIFAAPRVKPGPTPTPLSPIPPSPPFVPIPFPNTVIGVAATG